MKRLFLALSLAIFGRVSVHADDSSVQIGIAPARPITVGVSTTPYTAPLDQTVTLRMLKGSVEAFFDEISRQTRLHFRLHASFDGCTVTAYFHRAPARAALMVLLSIDGTTYQQLGRSDTYDIMRRQTPNAVGCRETPPPHEPRGNCHRIDGGKISVTCKDAPASDLAELLYADSNANIYFSGGAEDFPIDLKVRSASVPETIDRLRKNPALIVKNALPPPDRDAESPFVMISPKQR